MNSSQLVPLETVFKDLQRYLQWSLRILSRILNKALKWYYCQDRQRSVKIFNILVRVFEDPGLPDVSIFEGLEQGSSKILQRPCQDFWKSRRVLANQYLSFTIQYCAVPEFCWGWGFSKTKMFYRNRDF